MLTVAGCRLGMLQAVAFPVIRIRLPPLFLARPHILGGRSGSYEKVLRKAKNEAVNDMIAQARELGANAVVGVALDYETIELHEGGAMLMVSASGTAVVIE